MLKAITVSVSALALTATPVIASAAPLRTSPTVNLSKASAVRASTPAGKVDNLRGRGRGSIIAAVLAVVIVIGAVIVIADDDDNDSN